MHEKFQYYNGIKFTRDEKTGYYLNSTLRIRMHRFVWMCEKGEIPKGYDIHHIDQNKGNNDISNLELVTRGVHNKLHWEELPNEEKQKRLDNINNIARPKAIEWHKSEASKEWRSNMVKKAWEDGRLGKKSKFICELCGNEFERIYQPGHKFCSGACQQKYLRKMSPKEIRICVICGKQFEATKMQTAKTCSRKCAYAFRTKGN